MSEFCFIYSIVSPRGRGVKLGISKNVFGRQAHVPVRAASNSRSRPLYWDASEAVIRDQILYARQSAERGVLPGRVSFLRKGETRQARTKHLLTRQRKYIAWWAEYEATARGGAINTRSSILARNKA